MDKQLHTYSRNICIKAGPITHIQREYIKVNRNRTKELVLGQGMQKVTM
jgi:hypothetical protein